MSINGSLRMGLLQALSRISFWDEYRRLRREERLPLLELERLQADRLARLIRHAYDEVPFYRARFESAGVRPEDVTSVSDLRRLPRVSKEDLRAHYPDGVVARNANRTQLARKSTSGSSGVPFQMVCDRAYRATQMARSILGFEWAGAPFGTRCAVIASRSDDRGLSRKVYEKLKRELRCFMPSFDQVSIRDMYESMAAFRPHLIMGGVTTVSALADYMHANGKHGLRPAVVQSVAETLFEPQRRFFEHVLDCRVVSSYGSNEIYVTAQECLSHGNMHVFACDVVVEIVRHDGTPAAPGEMGSILLTDLHNYAMPFIRYDIGDLARPVAEPCPCGHPFPLMEIAEGRVSHLLVTPKRKFLEGAHYLELMAHFDWVRTFQLEQETDARIRVRVEANRDATPGMLADLTRRCQELADDSVHFVPEVVDAIPVKANGKRRYFISRLRNLPSPIPEQGETSAV